MKRVISIIVVCLILLCLAACQPTPDKDYVAKKDVTQMIEQARSTPISDMVQNENDQTVQSESTMSSVMTQPEERIQLSFKGKTTEDFCVEVDAKVTRPNVSLPIIRVSADDFDAETANRFYAVLTEGFDLYTPDQLDTAPALDEKIQKAMNEIANGNDEQPMKDYLNDLIEKRKTASNEIGDPVKRVEINHNRLFSIDEMQSFMYYQNGETSNGRILENASITYRNRSVCQDGSLESRVFFEEPQYVKNQESVPASCHGLSMTPNQAEAYATTLLKTLDLSYLQVSGLFINNYEDDESVYIAICDRFINGIPVTHPNFNSGNYEGSTYPVWYYEQAIICFNDKGLALFQYYAPLKIQDIVVEEANLLPFEDIMEHFQNMMCTKYEVELIEPTYHKNALTYYITDITLTLQRINEQDNIDYGLLVPVWNFWGYSAYVSSYDGQTHERAHIDGWYGSEPILSINAINGNIIDPIKGY